MGADDRDARDPGGAAAGSTGSPQTSRAFDSKGWLSDTTGEMRDSFARNRRVMSFAEYLTLFGAEPARQLRSAGQYLRDVFDHFGTESVRTPRGLMTRWRLFDCPFDAGKDALMGQEEVQAAVYRLISNFAREGRTNRLDPAARPERQRQVDVRRLHAARDGALLDARRGRALPLQLDLPVAEADQGGHRLRRRPRARRRRRRPTPTSTTSSSSPRSRTRCATTRCC